MGYLKKNIPGITDYWGKSVPLGTKRIRLPRKLKKIGKKWNGGECPYTGLWYRMNVLNPRYIQLEIKKICEY